MATTLERGAAEVELDALTRAGRVLAMARRLEMTANDAKPVEKAQAIARIMASDGLSATAAERIVETEPQYNEHLATCRASVVGRIEAETAWQVALLRAQLAVRAVGGVQ